MLAGPKETSINAKESTSKVDEGLVVRTLEEKEVDIGGAAGEEHEAVAKEVLGAASEVLKVNRSQMASIGQWTKWRWRTSSQLLKDREEMKVRTSIGLPVDVRR